MARVISTIQYPGAEVPPSAANLNQSQTRSLTDPEAQILLLLKAGKEQAEIAADVGAGGPEIRLQVHRDLDRLDGAHPPGLAADPDLRQPRR